jgi:hypothetical protein
MKNLRSSATGGTKRVHHTQSAVMSVTVVGPILPGGPLGSRDEISGAGGHEIFLRLPRNATAAARSFCNISNKSPFLQ